MSVIVIVPVRDEEVHLAECLESVAWADRVVVVDSGSTDRTAEIARAAAGVELVAHGYEGPAAQKNWALDHVAGRADWVLFLDADERVTPELAAEIRRVTSDPRTAAAGFLVNRRIVWGGRWIRHGGWFPNWNLRLLRVGRGRYERRRVHEHVVVDGPTARLRHHLVHEDVRDLSHQIRKHDRYSSDEAAEYAEHLSGGRDAYGRLFSRDPLARRRWVKTRLWARLPCKPLLYFVWAYFVRLGFLDGRAGFRFHRMHAAFKLFDELKLAELRDAERGPAPSYWSRHGGAPRAAVRGAAPSDGSPAPPLPSGRSPADGAGSGAARIPEKGSSRDRAGAEGTGTLGPTTAGGRKPPTGTPGGRS